MTSEKHSQSLVEDDFNYGTNVATANIKIRMTFIRRVYTLLSLQIILTISTTALFMFSKHLNAFVQDNSAVVFVSAFSSFVLMNVLVMYRHKRPVNSYLLVAFTFMEAVSVATTLTFYEYSTILQSLFLTCAVFAGLTVYTFQSKKDFSKLGAGLFACILIFVIAMLIQLFYNSDSADLVISGFGAVVFCGFIIYDTHKLMKQFSPDEYIVAFIHIYMDIIDLFMRILHILKSIKNQ
ncbi:ORF_095L [Scale drop disease virus]|uniref:ORF_095L n=1 Tax=Scale drop disease virus TaxID=1697349 RepID=A0A0K1L791_9VIRU|nr:ORF_095L [Scale drop disease virus]AKU37510.1 ORF_095L [Scale drop disease virus]